MKKPLIILAGPTGVGKTKLSLSLARTLQGEILSADSQAVYRGMDIGTAKIRPEEMEGIPHHLVDVADPRLPFDVTDYQKLAAERIREIHKRGHIPLLTGGTGFYIQAVLYGIQFTGEVSEKVRQDYVEMAALPGGREKLYQLLMERDPAYAETTHANNIKKVTRALEFMDSTGEKMSSHNAREREREPVYSSLYFVLSMEREALYSAIERRVDKMLEEGLEEEVRRLMEEGLGPQDQSMQAIGYKEIMDCFLGKCDRDTAILNLKKNTRHLAKRQMTWFRREKNVIFIDKTDKEEKEVLEEILFRIRQEKLDAAT